MRVLEVSSFALVIALAVVACRKDAPGDADRRAAIAAAIAEEAEMVDAARPDAGPPRRTVTFLFEQRDGGKPKRVFVHDVLVTRLLEDGGTTRVPVASADAGDPTLEQVFTLTAPEGSYRAKLLVGVCTALERDGGCVSRNPRPDTAHFVLPPSGDVVVEVR